MFALVVDLLRTLKTHETITPAVAEASRDASYYFEMFLCVKYHRMLLFSKNGTELVLNEKQP